LTERIVPLCLPVGSDTITGTRSITLPVKKIEAKFQFCKVGPDQMTHRTVKKCLSIVPPNGGVNLNSEFQCLHPTPEHDFQLAKQFFTHCLTEEHNITD
jgi:hypothetical protein